MPNTTRENVHLYWSTSSTDIREQSNCINAQWRYDYVQCENVEKDFHLQIGTKSQN